MALTSTNPSRTGASALDTWFTLPRFALFLLALLFVAFPNVWLGTQSFFRSDYGVLAYPFVHYHRESIWNGELPLWNPLSNCGAPFLAQWGTMVLYPGTLFYVLLPLPWSLGVFCLLHLWLGGLGMFKLAERWTQSRFAAAAAGTVFVFNGITLACLIWPNYTVGLGWMPWVVLLVQRAWKEGGRTVVLAALAASMQMLAGTPEIVVFTWGTLAALALLEMQNSKFKIQNPQAAKERETQRSLLAASDDPLPRPRRGGEGRGEGASSISSAAEADGNRTPKPIGHWSLVIGHSLLIIALVSALCAAQLLPFFDLLAHSQRDPSQAVGKWALPAWGWANLLVPMFRCAMSPQQFYFMQGQEFLTSCYVGAAALALAVLAVWKVRDRRVWLLAALAVFAVLMAMGNNGPLFPLVQKLIPVVGIARYPVKFLILVAFVASLLVAFGVKWCLSRSRRGDEADSNADCGVRNAESSESLLTSAATNETRAQQWQPLLVIATLLPAVALLVLWWMRGHPLKYDRYDETVENTVTRMVFFGLTLALLFQSCRAPRERTRLIAGLAALAFIAGDGLTHLKNQNPTIEAKLFAPGVGREGLARTPRLGQARVMISPEAEQVLLHIGSTNWAQEFAIKRRALWSNLNALDAVPKVNGSSTLRIREQDEVQRLLYETNASDSPRLLDFLSVAAVVPVEGGFSQSNRPSAWPFATSGQKPIYFSEQDTLAVLAQLGKQPPEGAIGDMVRTVGSVSWNLSDGVMLPKDAEPWIPRRDYSTARLTTNQVWSAQEITFETSATAPALVVIAQTFYHPWKAYVDDKPVPLLRANHAFQALEVPAGTHRVRLAYEDRRFRLGCVISLGALAVCGGLWWRGMSMTNDQ